MREETSYDRPNNWSEPVVSYVFPRVFETAYPRRGPIDHNAIAPPRLSGGNISPTVAPPRVIGVDPAHPAKKRKQISIPILVLTPHATVKTTKRKLEIRYNGFRPYISDKGATKGGPTAKPSTYMDMTHVSRKEL